MKSTFIGNSEIIDIIANLIASKKFYGSFAFYGKESIGKRTIALAIAKYFLKYNENTDFHAVLEREISSKGEFVHGSLLDIGQTKSEKSDIIDVEQTRQIVNFLNLTHLNKSIVIIDDAKNLNKSSFNALLKKIEEPPLNAIIILITDEINKLAETITSRCRKIYFKPVKNEELQINFPNINAQIIENSLNSPGLLKQFINYGDELLVKKTSILIENINNSNISEKIIDELNDDIILIKYINNHFFNLLKTNNFNYLDKEKLLYALDIFSEYFKSKITLNKKNKLFELFI